MLVISMYLYIVIFLYVPGNPHGLLVAILKLGLGHLVMKWCDGLQTQTTKPASNELWLRRESWLFAVGNDDPTKYVPSILFMD